MMESTRYEIEPHIGLKQSRFAGCGLSGIAGLSQYRTYLYRCLHLRPSHFALIRVYLRQKKVYGTVSQEICETNPFLFRVRSEERADVCVVFFFVFLQEGFHWLLVLKTL